jgi:hypothetical protein
MAFLVPYIYDYIMKLCRQQTEVIQNHENANIYDTRNSKALHRKYKWLKLGSGQTYSHSND